MKERTYSEASGIEPSFSLISNPAKTIEYAYDPAGNRTSMTGPDDIEVTYGYTLIDQIASITDVYNNATNYYYDDGGRLTLRTYANGTKAEFGYDDADRLTLLANKKSDDSVISSFSYEYDKAGNRTKRTTPSETLKYTYDNIYEVTEVYRLSEPSGVLEEFDYDAVGNRTTDTDYDDYTYNDNNQLTSYDNGDVDLYYDGNGNLTKKTVAGVGDTTYTWDYENQLTRVDYPDETYSAYKYDALGRRIEKRNRSGNIRRYYYDQYDLVAEYDGSNNLLATYTFGPGIDQPISMFRNGEIYYYHSDALGSITELTDDNETVVRSYDYSAFGEITSEAGTLANPFAYTGREFDEESGLYYYRFRYYDSGLGRFITHDPIYWLGGMNLYIYVDNNPLGRSDSLGIKSDKRQGEESSRPYPVEVISTTLDAIVGTFSSLGNAAAAAALYYMGKAWAERQQFDPFDPNSKIPQQPSEDHSGDFLDFPIPEQPSPQPPAAPDPGGEPQKPDPPCAPNCPPKGGS